MINKKYQTVKAVPNSNRDIVEKQATTNIHDSPLPWLDAGTSIKSGELKLVL